MGRGAEAGVEGAQAVVEEEDAPAAVDAQVAAAATTIKVTRASLGNRAGNHSPGTAMNTTSSQVPATML